MKKFYYDESEVNWSTGSSILSGTILYLILRVQLRQSSIIEIFLRQESWPERLPL